MNPAMAGPNAKPALKAMRNVENAVTRWLGGTRSVSKALLAGR